MQRKSALVFDCDGTLSQLEGINVLAQRNQVESEVAALTEEAMNQVGMTPAIYQQRLALVQPSYTQLKQLGADYYNQRAVDLDACLAELDQLNVTVFVASAGMNPAVIDFAERLAIPAPRVFAVDVKFNEQGAYVDFDRHSPMTQPGGKGQVITQLREQYDFIAHVGDGMNDLQVIDQVDCFIGYGGAFYRPNIEAACQHYIKTPSMLAILPILKSYF